MQQNECYQGQAVADYSKNFILINQSQFVKYKKVIKRPSWHSLGERLTALHDSCWFNRHLGEWIILYCPHHNPITKWGVGFRTQMILDPITKISLSVHLPIWHQGVSHEP